MKKDFLSSHLKTLSNQAMDLFIKSLYPISVPVRPCLSRKNKVIFKNEEVVLEVRDLDQSNFSYSRLSFHLLDKKDKEICNVGLFGFFNLAKPDNSVVVCYNTALDFQNKGYCSFLFQYSLEVLEKETCLDKVVASIFNNNLASLALVKKNGFQFIQSSPFGISTPSDNPARNEMSSWERVFTKNQNKEIA